MPTRLSLIEKGKWGADTWAHFRRVARYYERELRRIRNATACDATKLRQFAAAALSVKSKSK